jgi:hypothetical protein
MHNSLKIIKTLLYSYSALHVSGTFAPIIRSLLIQHIQPPVTVCRVGCIFQLWSVTTVAKARTGKNQQFFTHTSPPVEDGTDTVFRNVGFSRRTLLHGINLFQKSGCSFEDN